MYNCLLVGFMWARIRLGSDFCQIGHPYSYRVMSRNVSSVLLNSYMNLMCGVIG